MTVARLLLYHQDDLRKEDFSTMSAQLLYKMIKSKTEYPLHKAIKVEREDVVFLYLIEMDSQVGLRSPYVFIDRVLQSCNKKFVPLQRS